MGVYVAAGETYEIDVAGLSRSSSFRVVTPAEHVPPPDRRVTVRFADQEELRADENRTFRLLVSEADGMSRRDPVRGDRAAVPGPDHSHPYDEVGDIVEGTGLAHVAGETKAIGPGSCFHLPPGSIHCIENTGPGVMRIMGVFHPAGIPRSGVTTLPPRRGNLAPIRGNKQGPFSVKEL